MSEQKESKKQYVEPKVTTQGTVQDMTQGIEGNRNGSELPCLPLQVL